MRAEANEPRRRGRRPAGEDTRALILDAARAEFTAHGYEKTSGRAVARAAGVDPALVRHYFANKGELFAAVFVPLGINPMSRISELAPAGPEALAQGILRTVLSVWDTPLGRQRLRPIFAGLISADPKLSFFRDFLVRRVLGTVVEKIDVDHAELRVNLMASQIIGVLVAKVLLEIEPLASMDHESVVRMVGPSLVRYLTEPYEALAADLGE
ncbi:MAG: TetR family transcriptional regulator [Actinomycetota bacterium]|nr:TetR family transcriptional regulator [Actinomycetota bacterium]